MKNFKLIFFIASFLMTTQLKSQDSISNSIRVDITSFGVGGGLDYGGFGGNLLFCPTKNIGLFAGAGYALAGFGFNTGVKLRFVPNSPSTKYSAFGLIMYGYNTSIVVSNATQFNKLFFGPSIGIGLDYRTNPNGIGYWSFALLFPFRSSEVDDYIDDLKTNHGVEFKNNLLPIGFSIGYRIIIN
jgi:hypothetical protein